MKRPILLVEDAPNDIEFALFALKRCGVTNDIIVSSDDEQALDYLLCRADYRQRTPVNPGLVSLDMKLPAIDGIEVLRTIRASPALDRCLSWSSRLRQWKPTSIGRLRSELKNTSSSPRRYSSSSRLCADSLHG